MAAESGQLVGRLWAWRLGRWTPGEEAALREAVRLAAIKVLYTRELQVRGDVYALGLDCLGLVMKLLVLP
jgi:hypothetical protein